MANTQVRFGIITEVHIVPPGTPEGFWHNRFLFDRAEELFDKAVRRCEELGVDAIAILGDLTHFADPDSFARVRRVLETTTRPVFVLPGNHDIDGSARPLAAFHRAMDLPHVTIAPVALALDPQIDLTLIGLEPGEAASGYAAVRSRTATGNDPKLTVVLTHFPPCAMEAMLSD
ncbi:MAG: metallophosphoesterase, partial [Thermomicrobiales bacterium]|nr:metallophosphoesterase [Thermomicrobiales bacterium]